MKISNLLYTLLAAILFASSCAPKYTASFGPSQKFYNAEKTAPVNLVEADEPTSKVTQASEDVTPSPDVEAVTDVRETLDNTVLTASKSEKNTEKDATQRMAEIQEKYSKETISKEKIADMDKSEKKSLLKEVKSDLKELKKMEKKNSITSNRKVYIGIIIALIGIVLTILSGPLGGIAILIGVILIVWGLIEQGSINL